MILRKDYHMLYGTLILTLVFVGFQCEEASKNYDDNEWIPIARKQAQTEQQQQQPVAENVEKKATGRVLNLADSSANSFFPEEVKSTRNNNNLQQYLRETTTYPKTVPVLTQAVPLRVKGAAIHPYKFEGPRTTPSRSPKPQKAYYVPAIPQQFMQYYQPEEYHTIPEEFLNQPLQQSYFGQNFELPDLPPIRLNSTIKKTKLEPTGQKLEQDKENVQLLYVPLESLVAQNKPELPRLHAYQQAPLVDLPQQFINYRPLPATKQQQLHNIQSEFAKQAIEAHKLQLQLQQQQPQEETYLVPDNDPTSAPDIPTTTRKSVPTKRKAHQPPLAVYMGASKADVSDVLAILKDAKSIDVQDSVGPHSPNIFVGPSSLDAPQGYVKFDLPYLSSLDTNRVERKVDQYPFFVAPLSYKAPSGYSKIPLPSPHVGSVVVSTKEKDVPQAKPIPVQNLPDAYQIYTIQQRPIPATTPRFSKPISSGQVINQYDISDINAFIPQTQDSVSRDPESGLIRNPNVYEAKPEIPQNAPEKYNVDNFQPTGIRFASTRQPQLSEQYVDEILQQQPQKPIRTEYFASQFQPQNDGQYLSELTRPQPIQEQLEAQEYPQPARIPSRVRTTNPPAEEQYDEEVTKPTRVRTKPAHLRESYESPTRTTHLRTRPTTTSLPTTTTEAVDQYLKETVIDSRPRARPTTEKPKYSIQEQFSIGRATTPSSIQQYSPVTQDYEDEAKSHRPVIYKYKQSDDDAQVYNRPVYQTTTNTPLNQHTLNQEILDTKVLSNQPSASGNYVSGPGQIYQFQEEYEEPIKEQVKTQNANVENYSIGIQSPQPQVQLPNLINNLEDQSVRLLLQPGLIPTSPKSSDVERYEIRSVAPLTTPQPLTSNYPSTHLPIIETTTTRKAVTRGRVRGNRFSTTTPSSVTTTKRTQPTRGRRPSPSRSRYADEDDSTEGPVARSTADPTKKIVTARSRFRTRGRPTIQTTDRVSTAYDQDGTQSITQNQPSVQIIETSLNPRFNPEFVSYRPVYNIPADGNEPVLLSTRKVSKPATEPVVIHQINQLPIKNLEEENTENTSTRLRSRGRRPSTTIAPQTTEEKEEEFYGFFRKPIFSKPAEIPTTTETPRTVYSSTYVSSTLKPQTQGIDIQPQLRFQPSTDNIQFVGEIRPKYHTTEYFEAGQPSISTERTQTSTSRDVNEETSRVRTRARTPSRRIVAVDSKEDEETRTPVRSRARGKTHYRVPQKAKKAHDSTEDEDVEGGNYPVNFKALQTTARPSFQITVDPHDHDDQETFASIYRPTYIAKENNNKDSSYSRSVEFYQIPNYIPTPGNDAPLALPSIATAPEVNLAFEEQQHKPHDDESVAEMVDEMIQDYEEGNDNNKESHTEMPIELSGISDDTETPETENPYSYTTIASETSTQKRRRGVWKLVRRPMEVFEAAESQSGAGNQNQIEDQFTKPIPEKIVDEETTTYEEPAQIEEEMTTMSSRLSETTTKSSERGFLDSLYNMFGISNNKPIQKQEEDDNFDIETTTMRIAATEEPTKEVAEGEVEQLHEESATNQPAMPTLPIITTTTEGPTERPAEFETTTPLTSMTYITPMSVETWNMKTSTSTEISHETEICYKGKCIKSKDMKVPMT